MKLQPFPCAVLACALVFSLIAIALHLLQRVDAKFPFRGVEIMAADAEIHYVARMREIYDGFWQTGSTYYADLKQMPFLQPPLPEAVPALAARALRLDPVFVFIVFTALCAFALVLVMTGAIVALTGEVWAALFATCTLLFAGFALGAPWDIGKVIMGQGAFEPLRFTRPINPLWTAPWFFGAVWLAAEWWKTGRRALLLWCALPCVVLVYSYVYAWSYLAVSFAVLLVWLLACRDFRRATELFWCGALIVLCSIPYVLHLYETIHHPLYAESSVRLGVVATHAPVASIWFLAAICIAGAMYARRIATWPLVTSLLFAGFLVLNQQVFTGRAIVPHHYHWYFFHPLAALCLMTLVFSWLGRWRALHTVRTALYAVGIVILVVLGLRFQILSYLTARDIWGAQQRLAPVLRYIDEHYTAGNVVYSPESNVMDLVPIYTAADVYTATNANNYLVPLERARDTFFFNLWVHGLTAQQARDRFPATMRARLGSALYAIHFREQYGSYAAVPDDIVNENIAAYERYLDLSDTQKLARHRINVIVLADTQEVTPAIRTLISHSSEVLKTDGFSIRQMR